MKKKKIVALLSGALAMSMLSGCVCQDLNTTVNRDGSCSMAYTLAYSENFLRDQGATDADLTVEQLKAHDVEKYVMPNGVTYYGGTVTQDFASFPTGEVNFEAPNLPTYAFKNSDGVAPMSDQIEPIDMGGFALEPTESGFIFRGKMQENTTESDDTLPDGSQTDAGAMEQSIPEMYTCMSFRFPGATVVQTSGSTVFTTVHDDTISIDTMKCITAEIDNFDDLVFNVTYGGTPVVPETPAPITPVGIYMDVKSGDWYYKAIDELTKGGLIDGYGNGNFGPMDQLTVAQFCQILAKATNRPTGNGADGWWAGKAVEACVTAGLVSYRGDSYTQQAYDVPITREEAIAAIYMSGDFNPVPGRQISASQVPDYNEISEQYASMMLMSYVCGIIDGDQNGNMLPKKTLSRAEVCQLFFNAGWTVPNAGEKEIPTN